MESIWFGVILRIPYVEWVIALPLIISPILTIVDFVLDQLDSEGGE